MKTIIHMFQNIVRIFLLNFKLRKKMGNYIAEKCILDNKPKYSENYYIYIFAYSNIILWMGIFN